MVKKNYKSGIMSLNWLSKIFHKDKPKEWLKPLFDNIEFVWLGNKSIRFKIVEIKKNGFLVKTAGLFAYLPISLMPWQYKHFIHWNIVCKSLEGASFYGKITELKEKENKTYNIVVDATIHKFREIILQENEQYSGIVLHVYKYGLLVEIGGDFNWEYGSMVGFVSFLKFIDLNSFHGYESGAYIDVVFEGKTEKGLSFAEAEYFEIYSKYVGKTAWGKIYKDENSTIKILIEDKFNATLYKKNLEYLLSQYCDDGDIIDCKIINFDSKRGFMIKRIVNDGIDWESKEITEYLGNIVDVYVHRKDENLILLVDNKYPGLLPKKYYYRYNLTENSIIRFRVRSINPDSRHFGLGPVGFAAKQSTILDKIDEAIAEKLRNI